MKSICILLVVKCLLICGCVNTGPSLADDLKRKDSMASATKEAGKFLSDLHQQGKLPGLLNDDHG